MTTLKLYKGVAFDGVNSFPDIPTKAAFDTYLAGKQQYSQTVQYNRIGEPILIQKGYDEAISYSYGCIDTGVKKYFIIPDSINVNENGRVYLSYSVDWYTTLKYDSKISFGRSHLIKSTDVSPSAYPQSISPNDMRIEFVQPVYGKPTDTTVKATGMFISYMRDDETASLGYVYSPMERYFGIIDYDKKSISVEDIYDGLLPEITGIIPQNVINIWFSPIRLYTLPLEKDYSPDGAKFFYRSGSPYIGYYHTLDVNLHTDATHVGGLVDLNGNMVYTVPYGRVLTKIRYRPVMSWSQCFTELFFDYDSSSVDVTQSAENSYCLIPCSSIDFINNSYLNWTMGLKGVEIEERRIQKNKALVTGVSGSLTTGVFGGIGGNPTGAALGVGSGIVSAVASYGIETYYESNINRLEDRKYQLAQDTMVPGSFLHNENYNLSLVQLSAPDYDIARYNTEISNFGADCNLPLASWTPSPGAYKFADVEVIADVPYSIKQNIKQKMMNGIKIVDVT